MARLFLPFYLGTAMLLGCSQNDEWFAGKAEQSPVPTVVAPAPLIAPNDPTGMVTGGMRPSQMLDLPEGDSYLTNLQALIDATNLSGYHKLGKHGQNLTIAVLDNGFSGLNHSLGNRLPPDTVLVTPPIDQMEDTTHGVKLAEIVYAMITGKATYSADIVGPRMLLVNTDGFSNLQAAVATVIAEKVDIVLYAQVWQYGGNFDGKGFINAEIDKATAAGILWVNAAGNLGQATFNSGIVDSAVEPAEVVLPHAGRYVRFTVPRDQTKISAVLSWNDFSDTKDYVTAQDLDLIIEDDAHHVVASSRQRQTGVAPDPLAAPDPTYSAHAREVASATLNVGTYYARVEDYSHNFTTASRLRLSIDGEEVRLLDLSGGNTLGIPADNPSVLTVGASDISYSGAAINAQGATTKPEAQITSSVIFSDGEAHFGTSSASAIVTGALALYISNYGPLTRTKALELMRTGTLAAPRTDSSKAYTFRLK